MKTLLISLAIFLLVSGNVSAKCVSGECGKGIKGSMSQSNESNGKFGKHIRLHKGVDESVENISHCVEAGDMSRSNRIHEKSKKRVNAFKKKQKSNRAVRVVVDESSNACEIGTI